MLYIPLAFIAGFLTKIADLYSERNRKSLAISLPLGIIYGTAIGIVGLANTKLIPQMGGILLGNTLAFKVDKLEHYLAAITVLAFALYAGSLGATIDASILIAFMISAFADEKLHDYSTKENKRTGGVLGARLVTPITALVFAYFEVSYFISIVSYDCGYLFAEWAAGHQPNKKVYNNSFSNQ